MSEKEVWKKTSAVDGFEISSLGQIRKASTKKILKQYTQKGYKVIALYPKGKGTKRFRISRLMLQTFNGDPPDPSYHAAHLNGKPGDNRIENLKWCSPKENNAHKWLHGTEQIGETHGSSVHKNASVMAMRIMHFCGASETEIASVFRSNWATVNRIVKHKGWKHLPTAESFLKKCLSKLGASE